MSMIKHITFDTRKSDQPQDQPGAEKTEPPPPPKNQLRRRVETRIAELEAELERLGDDPAKHKQIRAIRFSLKGVYDTMSQNSANVGTMESATMTRWLESARYLGGGPSSAGSSGNSAGSGNSGSSDKSGSSGDSGNSGG